MAPSKLAYHLKELRQAGLLREEQRGKWVYYTLDREALTDFQQRLAARYGLGQ
jgi:ArsR family transcriptional regulator